MKKLLLLFLLTTSLSIFSQIPSYYNDVNMNLTGSALKDELATKIIGSHTSVLTYTPDVWNALKQTDIDPTDNTKVVLIYGWDDSDADITNDRTRGKDNHGSGSGVWNREHVYSKSLANPNLGTTGPGADAHNLRPADAQRNSSRSNRKFAAGSGTPSYITTEGYWYPGDEWKGDVARMMMYMYLRYGNQCLPTGVGIGNTVPTDPNMIDLFLQWNAEDPVSTIEMQRNPVLEQMQGNRNPFVDNPAFATQIWGGPQAQNLFNTGGNNNDTQAPTAPSGLVASNITQTSVDLNWTASTDNTAVAGYNIFNGSTQVGNTTATNYTISSLTAGTSYTFTVKAYDAAGNVSASSNTVNVTTLTNGGGSGNVSELLISEYVEGSSYNKAIEIANFTGASVNLADYSVKKATNGGGSWDATLALSGTLTHGNVYVIVNNSASTELKGKANLNTTSSVMSFNGNDAVALFKGASLIDVVGNPSSSATFAQDKTLQRKSSIKSPNTTYATAEWDVLASNTFSGLGTHTVDGGGSVDTEAPTAPANLITSNLTQTSVDLNWTASTDNVAVTGYEVYQNDAKIATVTTTNYGVTGLTADTAYNYSIKALDEAGNISALSNKVYITTLAVPDTEAPTAPSNLVVSNVQQTSADLAWTTSTDNVGVTGYEVYQGTTKIATVTTTNYSVTGLTAATNYTFSIKAIDEAGNVSSASNVIGVTTKSIPTSTSTILSQSYFESGWDNWADGGSDCARYSGSLSYEGNYSIRLRDNSGVASSMTSESYDLTSYDTVEVEFYFYSYSMETGEDFWLRYFDGNTWQTVAAYVSGTDFENTSFYTATVVLDKNNFNFVSNAQFRFQNDASANADQIFIDQVTITGKTGTTTAKGLASSNTITHLYQMDADLDLAEEGFRMYPNPVTGSVINVELQSDDTNTVTYSIKSIIGKAITSGILVNDTIDVSTLKQGVYFLEINDGEERMIKKFIKK
ncbi:endonuclease [Tenacibaculum crassostreae]|uniref:endonuclease n=1 Tax=Tenacibaculum crassostreae TaxID=502683 RepID=UPI003895E352